MPHTSVDTLIKKWLGRIECGEHHQAAGTIKHAFVKFEDIWDDEPLDESDEEDDEVET